MFYCVQYFGLLGKCKYTRYTGRTKFMWTSSGGIYLKVKIIRRFSLNPLHSTNILNSNFYMWDALTELKKNIVSVRWMCVCVRIYFHHVSLGIRPTKTLYGREFVANKTFLVHAHRHNSPHINFMLRVLSNTLWETYKTCAHNKHQSNP